MSWLKNKPLLPDTTTDTLMACMALFLTGKETRYERSVLRSRLMNHLREILRRDDYFMHPAVRALVRRLNAIHPETIPLSAELFHMQDQARLERETTTFLVQNHREGFVGDKFTFGYLFADLFRVDVHYHQPEEVCLSVYPFSKHHIHLTHENHRFGLIVPQRTIVRVSYRPPGGLLIARSNIQMPQFILYPDNRALVPPRERGYRVHSLHLDNNDTPKRLALMNGRRWEDSLTKNARGYVWVQYEPDGELILVSSVVHRTDPRFYLKRFPCTIYFVIATLIEESREAILVEC